MVLTTSIKDLEMKSTQLEQGVLIANQRRSLGFGCRLASLKAEIKLHNH